MFRLFSRIIRTTKHDKRHKRFSCERGKRFLQMLSGKQKLSPLSERLAEHAFNRFRFLFVRTDHRHCGYLRAHYPQRQTDCEVFR